MSDYSSFASRQTCVDFSPLAQLASPSGAASAGTHPRAYRFRGWELNLRTRYLQATNGYTVRLTKTEFGLLLAFLKQPRQILSRDAILDLTKAFADIYDRAIDVQILRLRRKIEFRPDHPALLKTVRGAGYVFDAENVQVLH